MIPYQFLPKSGNYEVEVHDVKVKVCGLWCLFDCWKNYQNYRVCWNPKVLLWDSPYARIVLIYAGSRWLNIPVQFYEAQMRIGQLDWVGVGKRRSQELEQLLANNTMLCRYRRTLRICFFLSLSFNIRLNNVNTLLSGRTRVKIVIKRHGKRQLFGDSKPAAQL